MFFLVLLVRCSPIVREYYIVASSVAEMMMNECRGGGTKVF